MPALASMQWADWENFITEDPGFEEWDYSHNIPTSPVGIRNQELTAEPLHLIPPQELISSVRFYNLTDKLGDQELKPELILVLNPNSGNPGPLTDKTVKTGASPPMDSTPIESTGKSIPVHLKLDSSHRASETATTPPTRYPFGGMANNPLGYFRHCIWRAFPRIPPDPYNRNFLASPDHLLSFPVLVH